MTFDPVHLKALADKLGKDVADELNKLHEKVFPSKTESEGTDAPAEADQGK